FIEQTIRALDIFPVHYQSEYTYLMTSIGLYKTLSESELNEISIDKFKDLFNSKITSLKNIVGNSKISEEMIHWKELVISGEYEEFEICCQAFINKYKKLIKEGHLTGPHPAFDDIISQCKAMHLIGKNFPYNKLSYYLDII